MEKGKILRIENQGTIILMFIETKDGKKMIPFDHRCFSNLIENNPTLQIGDAVEYDDENKTIFIVEKGD